MAKKNKVERPRAALASPGKAQGTIAKKRTLAKKRTVANKKTMTLATKSAGGAKRLLVNPPPGKRPVGRISVTAPLAKARKLSGDLYQAAGLALWDEAVEAAQEPDRTVLIELQDAICDAADLLREARATNPKHLQLYWVACFDREGLPATPPRFITAAGEDEALEIFRLAFKGEFGRRKPRAHLAPALADKPTLHDSSKP
jgi:hypothetical protein